MGPVTEKHHRGSKQLSKRLSAQSLLTFATTVGIIFVRVGKNAVISRILGPGYRGIWGLLTLVPNFLVYFGSFGFGQATIYYVARKRTNPRKVMGGILVFTLLMGAVLLGIGFLLLHFGLIKSPDIHIIERYRWLVLLATPILLLKTYSFSLLIGLSMIVLLNVCFFLDAILPLVIFLLLWWVGKGAALDAAVWSWFIGIVVIALLSLIMMHRRRVYPPLFSREFLKDGVTYGLSSHFANFFQNALRRIDFLFVAAMLGSEALGYYAIATSVSELLLTLPESVGVPFISKLFTLEKDEYNELTPLVMKAILVMMLCSSLAVMILGKVAINLIFGAEFLPAYMSMVLLLPGIVALGLYPFLKADLFGRNMPGVVSIMTGLVVPVNLVLNYVLIPAWGITGAAVSSSFCYSVVIVLLLYVYSKTSGYSVRDALIFNRQDIRILIDGMKRYFKET